MYKPADKTQTSLLDFDQPMGLHMNPDNRRIRMAHKIPWDKFEVKYADLFPSDTGNAAKPLRMALGALIIQSRFQFPDRELVEFGVKPDVSIDEEGYGRPEKVSFDAYN